MKRFPRDLCNLESRMRKKAALDQKAMLEKAELENTSATTNQTADMVSLGGDYFAYAACFKGFTRIHIRKFIADKEGWLHRTKDGVTMSPVVWTSLIKDFFKFRGNDCSNKVIVVNRELCVSKQTVTGEQVFVLQKLFQRKNLIFEFVCNHVVLNWSQFSKLDSNASLISDKVKENLITGSLKDFIMDEINQSEIDFESFVFPSLQDLEDSLANCILNSVTSKISELSNSRKTHFMQDMMLNRAEKYELYFEQSLFDLDWQEIAKDFINKNKSTDIKTAIFQEEFFDALNLKLLFKQIEKMYLAEEETVYKDLMLSLE